MPPRLDQGVGAPFFAGAKNRLRLPQPFTDRVGTVQLSGRRLDALPRSFGTAHFSSIDTALICLYHRAAYAQQQGNDSRSASRDRLIRQILASYTRALIGTCLRASEPVLQPNAASITQKKKARRVTSLYETLRHVKSEEDVKDAYIKALGLKAYTKGLIDIQTKDVWFEAKDTGKHSTYAQFTQLLHYVQGALNKGDEVPPFLAVIDTEKAAIMKSSDVIPFLGKKTVKWGKSASKYTQEALEEISAHIGTHFVSFRLATNEAEFIQTLKTAIQSGEIIRTQITPSNLRQVFDKWVELIGKEVEGVAPEDHTLLFYADMMHDGIVSSYKGLPASLAQVDGQPAFVLHGTLYKLGNKEGYRRFWAIYHRPPKTEYRDYLLERRDSLLPIDERMFKGAYYTALTTVDKAYETLSELLGPTWQKDYFVWDMCCGVGNLEVKHTNPRNLFMSTLDDADLAMMASTKTCAAATKFQYDYLNDDLSEDGTIDYGRSNKMPHIQTLGRPSCVLTLGFQ